MKKQKAKIENWSLNWTGNFRISGKVYGHPKFEDGEYIITSVIEVVNFKRMFAETKNTRYKLGVV